MLSRLTALILYPVSIKVQPACLLYFLLRTFMQIIKKSGNYEGAVTVHAKSACTETLLLTRMVPRMKQTLASISLTLTCTSSLSPGTTMRLNFADSIRVITGIVQEVLK
jgi:hypothetical protein